MPVGPPPERISPTVIFAGASPMIPPPARSSQAATDCGVLRERYYGFQRDSRCTQRMRADQPREVIRVTEACSWSCLAVVSPAQAEAIVNAISKIAKTVRGLMSSPEARVSTHQKTYEWNGKIATGKDLLHKRSGYDECSRFIADPLLWKCWISGADLSSVSV
jgi:hypothetical protein